MNKEQKLKLLVNFKTNYNNISSTLDKLNALVGGSPEGKLFNSVYDFIDSYIQTLAVIIGDEHGWLEWYIYDNDWGKKGYGATIDGKTINIKTFDDLLEVI